MKKVLFLEVVTIFKLIYLFWFKMEQILPGFGVTRFKSASASACFPSPLPGSCATWLRRSLHSTPRNGNQKKTIVNSSERCLENNQMVINSGFPTVNCRK